MHNSSNPASEELRKQVQDFNFQIRTRKLYYSRRRVLTTKVIFLDDDKDEIPDLKISSLNCCNLPIEIVHQWGTVDNSEIIYQFNLNESENQLHNANFISNCFANKLLSQTYGIKSARN